MDDSYYRELTESLKGVSDVTARIDERVKVLVEDNNLFKSRFEKITESQTSLVSRLSALEGNRDVVNIKNDIVLLQERLEYLSGKTIAIEQNMNLMEKSMVQHDSRWANIIDFFYKIGTIVIGAIILYKLGIKP